jgi:hypothetical protein
MTDASVPLAAAPFPLQIPQIIYRYAQAVCNATKSMWNHLMDVIPGLISFVIPGGS